MEFYKNCSSNPREGKKNRKKSRHTQKKNYKMVDLSPSMSVISLKYKWSKYAN